MVIINEKYLIFQSILTNLFLYYKIGVYNLTVKGKKTAKRQCRESADGASRCAMRGLLIPESPTEKSSDLVDSDGSRRYTGVLLFGRTRVGIIMPTRVVPRSNISSSLLCNPVLRKRAFLFQKPENPRRKLH